AVHMILSNPPYVAEGDINGLQQEVRDYEPRTALSAGADGLLFYRTIIPQAGHSLIKGGSLFLDIGYGQAEPLKRLLADDGSYTGIEAKKDLSGIERVLTAKKKF
ncbi:MAG: protein-(glutamine-N5) methyltransferase, release factor-specific, partial [Deltaproteobacteria bacterium]|nr:protein-(glutamine-N5) methyltransferase, release factor-specific [Deltaproteobacteria bacterium]